MIRGSDKCPLHRTEPAIASSESERRSFCLPGLKILGAIDIRPKILNTRGPEGGQRLFFSLEKNTTFNAISEQSV